MKHFLVSAILALIVTVFATPAMAQDFLDKQRSVAPVDALQLDPVQMESSPANSAPLIPLSLQIDESSLGENPDSAPWRSVRYAADRVTMIACIEPGPSLEDTAAIAKCGETLKSWGLWLQATAEHQNIVREAEQQVVEEPPQNSTEFSQPPWGKVVVGKQAKKKH